VSRCISTVHVYKCIFKISTLERNPGYTASSQGAETARRLTDATDLFNNAELDDSVFEGMDFEEYMIVESDSDCM